MDQRYARLTMTCDERELPPTTPIAGAERWIRAKVVMKGAEMCDTVVRHEISFPLHVGCDIDPGASSAPAACGTLGVGDIILRLTRGGAVELEEGSAGGTCHEERAPSALRKNRTTGVNTELELRGDGINRESLGHLSRSNAGRPEMFKIQRRGTKNTKMGSQAIYKNS